MAKAQAPHFSSCASNTGESATIAFPSGILVGVDGTTLTSGDEAAVFTPGGLCVGTVVWAGGGAAAAFPIWSDDPITPVIDGIRPDEVLHFRLWVRATNTEVGVAPTWVNVNYRPCSPGAGPCRDTGTYQPSVIFILETLVGHTVVTGEEGAEPGHVHLGPVSPNPVRASGRLVLELDELQDVSVVVLDLLGRHVLTLHDGPWPAGGSATLAIDGAGLPAGTYVVQARGRNFVRMRLFARQP